MNKKHILKTIKNRIGENDFDVEADISFCLNGCVVIGRLLTLF